MRETRLAKISIFENYAEHERAVQLKRLSSALDNQPDILNIIKKDLINLLGEQDSNPTVTLPP